MRKTGVGLSVALATLALAALAIVATGSAAHQAKQAPIKAAWIYVGPHNDGGWSQAHDKGRLYVQKKLGANVITTYKENVPEGPAGSQVIDSLVRDGNKIIFATSFGYMDAMAAAAKKYPDVYFEHATGYKTAKNFANYFGAGEDAIYLSGMAAGAATKNGRRRLRRPVPDPRDHPALERVRARRPGDASRREGQDRVDEVVVRPGQGEEGRREPRRRRRRRDRAERRQPGRRPVRAVERHSVGRVRLERQKFAPTSWLTAGLYNWGLYYLKRVKEAQNGTWKTGSYWGSMADGFTLIAPYGPKVSSKTKAMIASKRAAIISGKFYEFQGPLYDQSGKLRVPKGKRMTLPRDPLGRLARQGRRRQPEGLITDPDSSSAWASTSVGAHACGQGPDSPPPAGDIVDRVVYAGA